MTSVQLTCGQCYKTFLEEIQTKMGKIQIFPKLLQCYKNISGEISPFFIRNLEKFLLHFILARFLDSRFSPFFHRDMLLLRIDRNEIFKKCMPQISNLRYQISVEEKLGGNLESRCFYNIALTAFTRFLQFWRNFPILGDIQIFQILDGEKLYNIDHWAINCSAKCL